MMSRKRLPMMSQHIPAGVAYNILTQLPVKSIIRFRCVSKSWNSIFTDPIFITTNFKFNQAKSLSNNSHNGYLLYKENLSYGVKESHIVVCNNERTLSRVCSFEIPSIHDHIVGFCKGLFCHTGSMDDSYQRIYVWNPSIRKITIAATANNVGFAGVALGFAYHLQNNDFKILRLVCFQRELLYGSDGAEAEVYTWRTGSWRRFVVSVDYWSFIRDISQSPSLFFNGALHFLAQSGLFRFIMSFDVDEERFHKIMLPQNCFEGFFQHSKCLIVFKGSLALIVFDCNICHMWVMREYGVVESWTKISVPIKGVKRFYGCTVKGELLMEKSHSQIFSFDLESLNEKVLDIPTTAEDVIYADNFMESLNLFDVIDSEDY